MSNTQMIVGTLGAMVIIGMTYTNYCSRSQANVRHDVPYTRYTSRNNITDYSSRY